MGSYEENEHEHPKRQVRIGVYWNKPKSVTYPSNFGFGVNGYQPMIDYLDSKDNGGSLNKKDIYLPFLEERCLDQYSADKPYRNYTNSDINKYIDKGDSIIRQIRQNDAIGIGSALNRTHTNWSMSKKWVQLVKKSHVIDYRKIREERAAEEESTAPRARRANNNRGRSRQPRSRTPSISRRAVHSQVRGSEIPRTRSSSGTSSRLDKMVDTYEDVLSTLSHSKMDHEMLMSARRERLDDLDSQFEQVIDNLAMSLSKLNRKTANLEVPTVYDNARTRDDVIEATDDQILENQLRRQRELNRISEGVDDLTSGRSPSRSQQLGYEIDDMNDRLSNINQRQRDERLADLDALTALTQAAAAYAARKRLSKNIDLQDVQDEDISYLRNRNNTVKETVTIVKPKKKRSLPNADKLSDVYARVLNKASEMSNTSPSARRINNRARYVNIYTPKPDTADPELIVKPTRTEMNIDSMAKSFAERGKMTRRYDIDDEVDPPVSNLNTHAYNTYRNREVQRTIPEVPSNSSRVRYAVIRARARNHILGY